MTFYLGKFVVTTTCYQNLKVLDIQTNKHLWIPGPALSLTWKKMSIDALHKPLRRTIRK